MNKFFPKLFIVFSISLLVLFVIDKSTGTNPSDESYVYFGLSDIDSSSCQICSSTGEFYTSGCKRCTQDSVFFGLSSSVPNIFTTFWSNDNGVFIGDNDCTTKSTFTGTSKYDNLLTINLKKNGVELITTIKEINDKTIIDSGSLEFCSEPENLKFFRIITNDGKNNFEPITNHGKISGKLDNIKIYSIKNNISNVEKQEIFYEDFSSCTSLNCNEKWFFDNNENFFIKNEQLYFDSDFSGEKEYVHIELPEKLNADSWELEFDLIIDDYSEHPRGKGILHLEPFYRNMILLYFPLVTIFIISIYLLSRQILKNKS